MSDAPLFPQSAPVRSKPQRDLAIAFSAFIEFAEDRLYRWLIDPRLRRNMETCLQQVEACHRSEAAEDFWVLYWFRGWQQRPEGLAIGHLTAYLQDPCYWAARKVAMQKGTVSDYFQIAVAELPKILQRYDPQQPASLKSYAGFAFSNVIRDVQRQRGEADSRSDWGLLRKVSQKRLEESLQSAGYGSTTIAHYSLAWTCFKALWAPTARTGSRQLPRPDAHTWEAITTLYNRQRSQLSTPCPAGTPELLERWLKECASRIRAYLYPQTTSLNVSRFEPGSEDIQVDLPDPNRPSPLVELISQEEIQERQSQRQQISDVLTAAISQLNSQMQELLALYYQQGQTQQQIANRLEIKQYTVSRKLTSAKAELLAAVSRWSKDELHRPLTSPVVDQLNAALDEWLQMQYQQSNPGEQE